MLGGIDELRKVAAEAEAARQAAQKNDPYLVVGRCILQRPGEPGIGAAIENGATVIRRDCDGQCVIDEFRFRAKVHNALSWDCVNSEYAR